MGQPGDPSAKLLAGLMDATTEAEVVELLTEAGYWDHDASWRAYGDEENNYSTAGNQQSNPDAALVEKVINSVDAVLMGKALEQGIDVRGPHAPKSPREAVAIFFDGIAPGAVQDHQGYMADWTPSRRTDASRSITIALTGAQRAAPTVSVADAGEGQAPERIPDTILSLMRGIKKGIPFVQGKWNMGGTGALRFCGYHKLQLVLSKRHPVLAKSEGVSADWGFSVVRRDRPGEDTRVSTLRYLAPVGSDNSPRHGELLRVADQSLPIFPVANDAHARFGEWGTLVKLYEYQTKARSSFFLPDGLLGRLDIMMPGLILPVRLHECRSYAGTKAGSAETTLTGLEVRLRGHEGEAAGNLEPGFPDSGEITVRGETVRTTVYAFRKGRQGSYRKSEGVLFLVNGQTHATLNDRFFTRKSTGMDYLARSLLVVVDCSDMSDGTKEDLFMNSRDRLENGPLANQLEEDLAEVLKNHPALQLLIARRREEDTAEKLADSKPLEDVLKAIFKRSPAMAKWFLPGIRLGNPYSTEKVPVAKVFTGALHPTYFRFKGMATGTLLKRPAHLGQRVRLTFETDVENQYFRRPAHAGKRSLTGTLNGSEVQLDDAMSLHDGLAHLSIRIPLSASAGDVLKITLEVGDDTMVEPFANNAQLAIAAAAQPTSGPGSGRKRNPPKGKDHEEDRPSGITLPNVIPVKEPDWPEHEMTSNSVIRMKRSSTEEGDRLDFFLNVDNRFYKAELAGSRRDPKLMGAQYTHGMTLAGLAALRLSETVPTSDDDSSAEPVSAPEMVAYVTDALAPILLPMIDQLGALDAADLDFAGTDEDLSQDVA